MTIGHGFVRHYGCSSFECAMLHTIHVSSCAQIPRQCIQGVVAFIYFFSTLKLLISGSSTFQYTGLLQDYIQDVVPSIYWTSTCPFNVRQIGCMRDVGSTDGSLTGRPLLISPWMSSSAAATSSFFIEK